MNDTRNGPEPSTGVPGSSPEDSPRLCACGCGEPCKSTYIRGHNLRKDSRRKPKSEPEPESPAFAWDFGQPTWITDFPAVLNHDGNGTEIYGPCAKISTRHFHLTENVVTSLTSDVTFTEAVLCEENGSLIRGEDNRALWHIVKMGRKPAIVYEGRISVLATFEAYKITSGRTLTPLEWSRMVVIRAINKGGFTRERTIAAMDFEQQRARSKWIDSLDVSASGRVNDIKIYIRTQRSMLGDDGLAIHGQGPIFHEGSRLFVANSVVFDGEGNIRDDIRVDLTSILPETYAYYDVTPPGEITEDEIRAGCEELISAYRECPANPEIPAAFLGQLFTVPVAGIDPRFFTPVILTGVKGSGKTLYSARYDSVQSRTLRGFLKSIPPMINLGDTTGTEKGPKYRIKEISGFATATDDVIKAGDSPALIVQQSNKVSNLIRSFEGGAAPIGGVDFKIHELVSRESGALHTSIKFCSELPITGDGTQDRAIILPHLTEPWGKGGSFDKILALRLSDPESREMQHRAWSAFVYWLFQRQDTELEQCYGLAADETATWDIKSSRSTDRYTALIAGNLMFGRFCEAHGVDAGDTVSLAVKALHACALRQAETAVSPAIAFRKSIQLMMADQRIAFPGTPAVNPDGSEASSYSDPRRAVRKHNEEDGTDYVEYILPPGIARLAELGLSLTGAGTPSPGGIAKVYGYVMSPRKDKGGKTGSDLSHKWSIAIPAKMQTPLCNALTEYGKTRGGAAFDKATLIRSLEKEDAGGRAVRKISDSDDPETRKRIKQERILEIDFEWLFTPDSEED